MERGLQSAGTPELPQFRTFHGGVLKFERSGGLKSALLPESVLSRLFMIGIAIMARKS